MIHYLDETLRILLSEVMSGMQPHSIQFERPTKTWEDQTTEPRINCFLYDIRENTELRFDRQQYLDVPPNQKTGTRQVAPRRIDFTYLITAWCAEVSDEHELLGNVLLTLLRYPTLPKDKLHQNLQNQPFPIRTWVSQPEDTPKIWEFWGANEWRLKAGISYRLILAIAPTPEEVKLPNETRININIDDNPKSKTQNPKLN
jgi:hypothetical protein